MRYASLHRENYLVCLSWFDEKVNLNKCPLSQNNNFVICIFFFNSQINLSKYFFLIKLKYLQKYLSQWKKILLYFLFYLSSLFSQKYKVRFSKLNVLNKQSKMVINLVLVALLFYHKYKVYYVRPAPLCLSAKPAK